MVLPPFAIIRWNIVTPAYIYLASYVNPLFTSGKKCRSEEKDQLKRKRPLAFLGLPILAFRIEPPLMLDDKLERHRFPERVDENVGFER